MLRKSLLLVVMVIFIFSLGGCATARRQKDMEIQGLRNQVSALEIQLQEKDQEINSLRESMASSVEKKAGVAKKAVTKRVIGEVKSRLSVKQIQIALRNAGFDPGALDGRLGRQTREAIKSFQRANNLEADGKVGKKTSGLLKDYLYKKVK